MVEENEVTSALLKAALPHVCFDGWSPDTFAAAQTDAGIDPDLAKLHCPKGAVDLAILYHKQGDAAMGTALATHDLKTMRIRDRVALAVRLRIEAIGDKEAVRRGSTLFALPQHSAEGAALIWGTADKIWDTLGDSSTDYNWYSKRAILSGVYGSTILFWLGDDSEGSMDTWAFLDRRVDNVMAIEKLKGGLRQNPLTKNLMAGLETALSKVSAPSGNSSRNLPGRWSHDT